MFLNEPGRTNFDINFKLFGFPVRIHPLFFVLPIIFVAGPGADGPLILIFVLTFFISILVHELGHAVVMRYFGKQARIVLYMMGGLAIPESTFAWNAGSTSAFTSKQQVLVSLAGPVAGFLLAVLITLIVWLMGGQIAISFAGVIPFFQISFDESLNISRYLWVLLQMGLLINIYLNLLNLAPVIPLDGGQISRELFVQKDPWNGVRYSLVLSIAVAVFIALFALMNRSSFIAIFFGFMAWNNWMVYQQLTGGGFGGGGFGGGGFGRRW